MPLTSFTDMLAISETNKMSLSKEKEKKYVYDIKYSDRQKLCQMLDVSDKWKDIGGEIGYNMDQLNYFELAFKSGGSPTNSVLQDWSHRNPLISKFYEILQKLDLRREMDILKKYLPLDIDELAGNISDENNMLSLNSGDFDRRVLPRPGDQFPFKWTQPESYCRNFSRDEQPSQDNNHCFNSFPTQLKPDQHSPLSHHDFYRSTSQNKGSSPEVLYKRNQYQGPGFTYDSSSQTKLHLENCSPQQHYDRPHRREPVESQDDSEVKKEDIPDSPSSGLHQFASQNMVKFDIDEIKQGTSGFDKELVLGSGGFGTVYKCKLNGTYYAVKRLENDADCHHSLAEIKALSRYRHENIVQLCGYSHDEKTDQFILVLELLPNGSLEDRLACKSNTKPLTWQQRHSIMLGAAKGVLYLHNTAPDKLLFHGDIKSANILLDANFKAKISDFGLAKEKKKNRAQETVTTTEKLTIATCYGSEHYLPSDYKRSGKPSAKVDVHCFGVVLLEVTTGLTPMISGNKLLKDHVEEYYENRKASLLKDQQVEEWPELYWNEMLMLGLDCTKSKVKQRPQMKEVFDRLEKVQEDIQKSSMTDKLSEPDLVSNAVNFKSEGGVDPSLHGEQLKKGKLASPTLEKKSSYVKTGKCVEETSSCEDPKWLRYDKSKICDTDSSEKDIYSADPAKMSYDYKKLGESSPREDPNKREAMQLQRHYDEQNSMKSQDSKEVVSLKQGNKKYDSQAPDKTGKYNEESTLPKSLAAQNETENVESMPDENLAENVKKLRIANGASIEEDEIRKKAGTKKFLPFLDTSSVNSVPSQSQAHETSLEKSADAENVAFSNFDDSEVIAKAASKKNYPNFLDTNSVCSSTFDGRSLSSDQTDADEMSSRLMGKVSTMGNNSQVSVTAPSRVYSDK